MTDPSLDEALRALLTGPDHGVKVMLTTRVAPRELLLIEPGRQRRLNLDEGLGSPFAENILRAMDPDASLGLRDAPDELLALARERTRGFPRALEALAAILSADRDTTLPELLAETARLPGNVVEALVGEAFSRLDPLAQQVMQALAVFPVPVPAVAVDYLLQPYRAAIDAAPVLGRLVNMAFVRRDAGRYYLHQVDRDYALARIPAGEPADRDTDPPPFTQQALRHRGANYFEITRTPRETWKTLDDLAPQLAEFELRCQGGDYDTAATVLGGIDFDYLRVWGHYRILISLHERIHGTHHRPHPERRPPRPTWGSATSAWAITGRPSTCTPRRWPSSATSATARARAPMLGNLGLCYFSLGEYRRAIDLHTQALAIARDIGDRQGEGADLGNLGNCHYRLGRLPAGHRPVHPGAGHRPRHRRPPGRGRRPGQPGELLLQPGRVPAGHRPAHPGAGHRPRHRQPPGRGQRIWATWGSATTAWATTGRPSTCRSRRWTSPATSATGRARAIGWATWGSATTTWAITGRPSTCTPRRWASPATSATATSRRSR